MERREKERNSCVSRESERETELWRERVCVVCGERKRERERETRATEEKTERNSCEYVYSERERVSELCVESESCVC